MVQNRTRALSFVFEIDQQQTFKLSVTMSCKPLDMLRALWDFTVSCWRRLRIFCIRIRSPARAPTADRIVAFQAQSSQPRRIHFRRQFSTQAHDGSLSSNQDGTLSDQSPSFEFSIPETVSQTSRNSGPSAELNVADPGPMPRNVEVGGQVLQDTPLLHREASQRSPEKQSAAPASASNPAADSSERFYRTF